MRTCPYCRARVRDENFTDHLARVHAASGGEMKRTADPRRRTLLVAVLAGIALIVVLAFVFQNRRSARIPSSTAPSGAVTAAVGTRVGEVAPEFRVVDMDRKPVTRESLVASKPGLIFFTAAWCLPCIEGLRHLAKFQQDVGGEPFRVLVVFVDPRETNDDLRAYRERFGFPTTWHYALDGDQMVIKYGIRFLDTKFVLDPRGVIRFTDVYPANYQTWRRALATVGVRP